MNDQDIPDPLPADANDDALACLPEDRLYAPMQDMWIRIEDDATLTIGATHFVAAHGQFMYFTPRPVGTRIERDHSMGVMETAKTVVAVHAPISCEILEVNEEIVGNVQPIEQDPYGRGWMFRVVATAFEPEREHLLDAEAYREWLKPRLAEKQAEKPLDDEFYEDLTVDPNRGY